MGLVSFMRDNAGCGFLNPRIHYNGMERTRRAGTIHLVHRITAAPIPKRLGAMGELKVRAAAHKLQKNSKRAMHTEWEGLGTQDYRPVHANCSEGME